MDKELENLLDNYENAIYGQAFPITPSIHQLHLLLDYIANLEQQCKKQKEVIDKAIEYINKYAWQEDIIGGIYTTNGKPATDRYMKLEWDNCNELLDILKEVSE